MGKVIPLQNVYCNLRRMQELQAIGELMIRAEQLFLSLNPLMAYAYREAIMKRAIELLTEAHQRRYIYFISQGKPAPKQICLPHTLREN